MSIIRKVLAPILTALLYIVILVVVVASITFVFDFNNEWFWTTTIISVIIVVLTNLIWLPNGKEKGNKEKKIYTNTKIFNNRANYIVNNQMFKKAEEFCEYKNEKFKELLIKRKLAEHTMDYWAYELYVDRNIKKEDKDKLDKYLSTLTKKQIKCLKNLKTKEIKFEKLQPKNLTIGKSFKRSNVPHNYENIYTSTLIASKVIWGFIMGCILTFAIISPDETFGIEQVFKLVIWLFSITYNVYTGLNAGYKSIVVYKNNFMVEQNELCAEFFGYANIKVTEVDNLIQQDEKTEEPEKTIKENLQEQFYIKQKDDDEIIPI